MSSRIVASDEINAMFTKRWQWIKTRKLLVLLKRIHIENRVNMDI